ncbi:hypothetical protein HUT18_08065 [Streptomyces sp. NA04227]|uniref:hypothetical protein n=1 Tax=Streptomyces sp. NA04227 TaxID=2742136 RepID=UPI001590DEB4|nr:hypothetical protein [Streptomyces sp. NA04227]QKW06361.1 hypothetical protein HUT18_08065 [Streptomyces sp. NA04227]
MESPVKTRLRTAAVTLCLSLAALGTTTACGNEDDECDEAAGTTSVAVAQNHLTDAKAAKGKGGKHRHSSDDDDDCDDDDEDGDDD